ncbi:MAG TPA: biotin-dependent carboxyltransferase family protein [Candidatus Polarisedimenticolaceae bacterium]|nr:biotin-dependent carboxyltransferase family protein [Candidatus Polarisedimenticolaceae bacterium]
MITVVAPGFLTTVQDAGRPGFADLGVSASGAADPIALAVGNRLVGNDPAAAALEMTLVGGTFRFAAGGWIALCGAPAAAKLDGLEIPGWSVQRVRAGGELACGAMTQGARAYLCVRGGLDVPPVLGSGSTHLASGLGGLAGRALAAGDRLELDDRIVAEPASRPVDPSRIPGYRPGDPFRVTEGLQSSWFMREAQAALVATTWRTTDACDRMGLRLEGPALRLQAPRELTTEGVTLGAIQVPADGRPIILFVEHQTTGGYPKIGCVISADHARLGQLRPRTALRFARVEADEAVRLLREQAQAIDAIVR